MADGSRGPRGGERRATRRATDAMRHKTARAYMYGYATHSKPQGYTSRPPLLTTKKVFNSRPLLMGMLGMLEEDNGDNARKT